MCFIKVLISNFSSCVFTFWAESLSDTAPKICGKKNICLLLSSISRSFLKTASDFWWSQLMTPDAWDKNDPKYNITNINWTYINDFLPGHQFLFTKWELWSQLISLLLPKIAADIMYNGMKSESKGFYDLSSIFPACVARSWKLA